MNPNQNLRLFIRLFKIGYVGVALLGLLALHCRCDMLSFVVQLQDGHYVDFKYDPEAFLSSLNHTDCLEKTVEKFCYKFELSLSDCMRIMNESFLKLDNFRHALLRPSLIQMLLSTNDSSQTLVPKNVFQTYVQKDLIPEFVYENIKKFSKGYQHFLFDDNDAKVFLEQYFQKPVLDTFENLNGAHKADLLRYALLFVMGGVYVDIKTEPLVPFDYLFNESHTVYTSLSILSNFIHNGIIASPKHNLIFLSLINQMVHVINPVKVNINEYEKGDMYLKYCFLFFERIKQETKQNILKEGLNVGVIDNKYNFILFKEHNRSIVECHDGMDKYYSCSFVFYRGEKVFKTRYSDYPWH